MLKALLISSIASTISIDAFLTPSLNTASSVGINSWQSKPLVSPLHADESGSSAEEQDDGSTETEETAEDHLLASEEESDILNSPAFLKRKVEVLQSDIDAMEKEIEEANTVYLAGKEEWGSKFDMLVKEVSLICMEWCNFHVDFVYFLLITSLLTTYEHII